MSWPEILRIEVKTTTLESVPLPIRELDSLAVRADNEAGILAALFWCGDRAVDGRWLIADAQDTFRRNNAQSLAVSKAKMQQAHRGQSWLLDLKTHIDNFWPAFLQGFLDDAMLGHEALSNVLQEHHEHGTTATQLSTERILETDHRDAIRQIIERFGESQAGHVFQDLIAYLIGYAGYSKVMLNAVGVPDATLSGFRTEETAGVNVDLGHFSIGETRRLLSLCEQAGDRELAKRISAVLASAEPT